MGHCRRLVQPGAARACRCATAATHSDVCWRRDLLKMGGAGVEKREPEEEWKSEEWKATTVYHWGSKNSYEEEELPECSLDRPRVDAKEGSRFLGWQNEDLRSVICELDRKNKLLQKKVEEQDAEKQAERDKHKMEKKMIARISKEKLMCRDRMLVFATAMCLGLCAILFALAVK